MHNVSVSYVKKVNSEDKKTLVVRLWFPVANLADSYPEAVKAGQVAMGAGRLIQVRVWDMT